MLNKKPLVIGTFMEKHSTGLTVLQGSGHEDTWPGTDTWWASGSCHSTHSLGWHGWKGGERFGTGIWQLLILAQGAWWHSFTCHRGNQEGNVLAGYLGPASVFVSGSPQFPELQMSLELSRLSFSNVLPWLLMEGRKEGSTRLLYYRVLIEEQNQLTSNANCTHCTPGGKYEPCIVCLRKNMFK